MITNYISEDVQFNTIRPNITPLIELKSLFGVQKLWVKDESYNLTHTFKDRMAFEMLKPILVKLQNGEEITTTTFASISYGNTANSLGRYCKIVNDIAGKEIVNAIAFIPPTLKQKNFGPDTSNKYVLASDVLEEISKYCKIIEIDLTKKVYTEIDLEQIARDSGLCLEEFIDVTEGLNRPAYENIISEVLEIQLDETPDYIIVPFGAGILCNEIRDYIDKNNLKSKVIAVSSGDSNTIAVMLYGPIWVDTISLLNEGVGLTRHNIIDRKGITREPYLVYHVTDDEILSTLEKLKDLNISCEPSGASGFAILHRINKILPEFNPSKSILIINTGNGLANF